MRILLAVDGSTYSAVAADTVAKRPWPAETLVRVLSAIENTVPPAVELWYDSGGNLEEIRRQITSQAKRLTGEVAEKLRASGLMVETAVRDGDPRGVIIDEAIAWNADLIVAGSHGYTGVKRWLLGSVALSVVSHAPCSVEIVRQKRTEES